MAKPHAVIVPHPAQGHMNPMLKLAKLLYLKGFYITFVNSEYNHNRLLRARGPTALDGLPGFKFAAVAEGLPAEVDGVETNVQEPYIHCDALLRETPLPFFKEFVDDLRSSTEVPPISCFVCDGNMTFPLKVAREIGVPCALFWTPSACGVLGYAYYRKLIERGLVPLKDESCLTNGYLNTVVDIPSMEGIRLWDLPHFVRTTDTEHIMFKFLMTEVEKAYNCSAIILNTIDALEHGVLDTLRTMFPPIYAIGPLNLIEKKQIPESSALNSIGLNLWKEDLDCLAWLDKKEPNSVIYVNFGSVVRMSSQELVEFGWGLATSKQNFLWAIRPGLLGGESAVFPPEFEVEIKERGLLVGWTPQEKILRHPSVGGYLTHCGWNSVLESIVEGVPMICWPAWAEQYTNCWFLWKHWGLGMELTNVERKEVERLVRELMVGENGKKIKAKAFEWKKVVEDAVTVPAGSSCVNFDNLINEVLLSKFQTC
ncbi:7-deoxyloganetin glucosyltransferase-like [Rhododendron vialii]|uniref:7-deoxyloganetin glucosyltransferase-like n=1 Tax=Rhododendron vialii TaxID=182163 RepID=UPI00265E1DC9|nr:7-deoxyloganetin glucosyltransferase-like [Rhododendron vialii]